MEDVPSLINLQVFIIAMVFVVMFFLSFLKGSPQGREVQEAGGRELDVSTRSWSCSRSFLVATAHGSRLIFCHAVAPWSFTRALAGTEMSKPFDSGGCADIYELSEERVLKAFRRRSHTNAFGIVDWEDHDAITRAQFRAEALAYEHLQAHPSLEIYVPRYFGRVDPIEFLQLEPDDQRYLGGCGLVLERIPGRARKMSCVESALEQQVSKVLEQIRDTLGLDHVWDGSCFAPGSRAPFTVIDFALWDAGDYEMALAKDGRLTASERARLSLENTR